MKEIVKMFIINDKSEYIEGLNEEKNQERAEIHSFHRYYGKLIPAIPSYFIKEFTNENDLVFDPFCRFWNCGSRSKKVK